tara:strand:- start:937 stop:1296 length:360 start_codon:yes stop_codon:yes gene_type:complete
VASLIFVAAKINQGNHFAKATIRQSLNETDMQIFAITMDQSIFTKTNYKLTKGEALNDYEKHQLEKYREFNFRDYDNSFYQYQIGLFEEETWQAYNKDSKQTEMWSNNKENFSFSLKRI